MFNFKLQTVLDYRKQLEEKQMLEFAVTEKRLNCEKETLRKLRRKKGDLISRLEKMGEGKLSAADASTYLSYISRIKDEENQREDVICQIGKELKEKRAELVDASKKKRILEILKEKSLKEYKVSWINRERKELDEAGIFRAGARGRGSGVR